ncbi:hypothetical protein [Aliivibrio fischeri]|uniref:hypothetical protein n=1 Tax=Aliivibrio fischeri TaxID=668 RepID=UPI0007C56548|nr:hypothetical protein [Aliivibrio fischeri]
MPLDIPEIVLNNAKNKEQNNFSKDLNGKRITLYTLTEPVGHRVKSKLLELFPNADVRINSDKVDTEELKMLARESDYFVFSWLSTAHQAYFTIKAERINHYFNCKVREVVVCCVAC